MTISETFCLEQFNLMKAKTTIKNEREVSKEVSQILQKIKELRKQRKVSLAELGKALDYTEQGIGAILRGRNALTIEMLLKIAKVLDVDPTSLLPITEEDKQKPSFNEYIESIVDARVKAILESQKEKK